MSAFLAIAAALSVAQGMSQFWAYRQGGRAQERAGAYAETLAGRQAEVLLQEAGQRRAVSQREAIEQRRQGRFVESRATALAAASGAGVSDPTITGILADIDTESEIRALYSMYEGEEAARGLEYDAQLALAAGEEAHWSGKVAKRLAYSQANSALLSGAASGAMLGAQAWNAGASSTLAGTEGSTLNTKYAIDPNPGSFKWHGGRKYY